MSINRRDLLIGMVVGGATTALARNLPARMLMNTTAMTAGLISDSTGPQILVVGSPHDSVFLAGTASAVTRLGRGPVPVYLSESLDSALPQLETMLACGRPLVALLPSAEGTLLCDLARSAGSRLVFEGVHSLGHPLWAQRHELTTSSRSLGIAAALAVGLGQQSFAVTESPLGIQAGKHRAVPGFDAFGVTAPRELTLHLSQVSKEEGCAVLGLEARSASRLSPCVSAQTAGNQPWAAALGKALFQVASGSWKPESAGGPQAFLARRATEAMAPDNLTSLVICP